MYFKTMLIKMGVIFIVIKEDLIEVIIFVEYLLIVMMANLPSKLLA